MFAFVFYVFRAVVVRIQKAWADYEAEVAEENKKEEAK